MKKTMGVKMNVKVQKVEFEKTLAEKSVGVASAKTKQEK